MDMALRGIFFLLAFITLLNGVAFGQSLTTRGRAFWLGFMENNSTVYQRGEFISIYISSRTPTSGTVTVPLGGFSQPFNVVPGTITEVRMPVGLILSVGSDRIDRKGIFVSAVDSINVYGINYQIATEDASVILPLNTLREDYFVMSYNEGSNGASEFLIVATEDNTVLTIRPTGLINGRTDTQPYNITLNRGQTYQAQSLEDLTGTRITAAEGSGCKRFAVFGGNSCTNVGGCGRCDHLFEQMFPINTWGRSYVVAPLKTRSFDLIRILAAENGTSVTAGNQTFNLNAGEFRDINIRGEAIFIQGSKPVSVAQFSVGGCCEPGIDCRDDASIYADPFMLLISPTEQMAITASTFSSFQIPNIRRNFINIISRTAFNSQVKRNGTQIPASEFKPVPGRPQFSFAQIEVNQGTHTITADSGIIAYVYGFGERDSYGYSGDVVLNNLNLRLLADKEVACAGQPVRFTARRFGSQVITNYRFLFGDGTEQNRNDSTAVKTYTRPGTYTVKVIVDRAGTACRLDSTEKMITVRPVGETPELEPGVIAQDQTVCPGRPVNRLTLSGQRGAFIEWQQSADNGQNWTPIQGANANTYQPVNITRETLFRVRISDGSCGEEFTVRPAKIALSAGVTEGRIDGGKTVCADTTSPTLTLVGYEGAEVLKWQRSEDGLTWRDLDHQGRVYSPRDRIKITRSTYYRAVLNFGACGTVETETTLVALVPPSLGGTISGGNTFCPGQSLNLNLTGQRGRVLRWEVSSPGSGGTRWETVPGSAGQTELQVANPRTSLRFRAVVANEQCEPAFSSEAAVNLVEDSSPGVLEGGKTLCASKGSGDLTLRNFTGTVIRWESSLGGNPVVWTSISNTSPTYNTGEITGSVSYRVWVRTPCGDVPSNSVRVSFVPPTVAGTITGAASVCEGQTDLTLKLTGNTGNVVSWERAFAPSFTYQPVANTTSELKTGNLTATTRYRVRVRNGECEALLTEPVEIKYSVKPQVGRISGAQSFCSETAKVTLSLSTSVGEIEKWQVSNNPSVWRDINFTGTEYNTGDLNFSTFYRVIVKTDCGRDTSDAVQVVINPPSKGGTLVGDRTVCAGAVNIRLELSGQTGAVTGWESSPDGTRWNSISASGSTLTLTNLTTTTFYRATVQNTGCPPVKSSVAKITVDKATVVPGTLSGDTAACAAGIATVIRLKGYTGIVTRYEASTDSGKTWFIPSQPFVTDSFRIDNQTRTTRYRVLVRNGDCAEAYSNEVNIINKPLTVPGELASTQFVCQGSPAQPLKLLGYKGIIVNWEKSPTGFDGWQQIAGQTAPQLEVGIPDARTYYRVLVKNGDCAEGYSNIVMVEINLPTKGGVALGGDTACTALSPNLKVDSTLGTVIRWEKSIDNGETWDKLAVFTPAWQPDSVRKTTLFRAIVKNGGCKEEASKPTEVFIIATKSGKITPAVSEICLGERPPKISLTDIDSLEILGWQASKDNGGNWTDIGKDSLPEIQPYRLTVPTLFRAILKTPKCPPFFSPSARVNVLNPNMPDGKITGTTKVCRAQNTVRLILTGHKGTVTRWESSADRWATVTTLPGTKDTILVNNITGTTQFRAVVTGKCGVQRSVVHVTEFGDGKVDFSVKVIPGCASAAIQARTTGPGAFFSIDPQVAPPNRTGDFRNLMPGKYKINIKDSTGCEADTTVEVKDTLPAVPVILKITPVTQTGANITWRRTEGAKVSYILRYRVVGSSSWLSVQGINDTTRFLLGLNENTRYEVQVAARCPDGRLTDWSTDSLRFFRTVARDWDCSKPDFPIPSGMFIGDVTKNTGSIHWNPIPTTQGYIVSYGPIRQHVSSWVQTVVCHPDTFLTLINLFPNTFYGVRMRTNCSNCTTALKTEDKRSLWSGILTFRTLTRRESEILATLPNEFNVNLYPNPNNGRFTLHFSGNEGTKLELILTDMNGKTLYRSEEELKTSEKSVEFEDLNLPSGIYLWRIRTDSGAIHTVKMVAE